jgi:hypothetical protein
LSERWTQSLKRLRLNRQRLLGLACVAFIVGAVAVALLITDSSTNGPAQARDYPVTTGAMTHDIPADVTRVCQRSKSRRALRIPVICPSRVPAGRVDRQLGAGMLVYRTEPRLYFMAFYSNEDPSLSRPAEARHWIVGAGRTAAMHRFVFTEVDYEQPHSVPRRLRKLTFDGIAVRLYRSPHYPRGGMFGDHTIAVAPCGANETVLGSVHGYRHEDMSIALAIALAQDPHCSSA